MVGSVEVWWIRELCPAPLSRDPLKVSERFRVLWHKDMAVNVRTPLVIKQFNYATRTPDTFHNLR